MCQVLGLQEDLFYDNLLEFIADRIGSQGRCNSIDVGGYPFITFAERREGGGYPKANIVSKVA